ncbi:hypothetical protein VMCG_06967 [Cytospora schulzeri]|uniref:Acetyltransferase component of pyruvate dehydrogenase complex n=1 Tax=Cytospora schulzeri TaxID=448051 RepID=A0A423W451_9PEZI|nr:hypothetical protein VMCG_06967 [Valsa malicola]
MLAPVLRRQALHPRSALRSVLPSTSNLARWYASYPPHSVVRMPALSPTMTAGAIGTWQKKIGDKIEPGEVLVELETDKAQMDFEFQEDGVLAKVLRESGARDVAVGNPIAVMVEEGVDVKAFEGFTLQDAGGDVAAPGESKEEPKKEESSAPAPTPESAPETQETGFSGKFETSLDREPNATPAAKRLAIEKGIKVSSVKGSGPNGKITEEDVKKSAASPAAAAPGAAYEDIPLSGMRKVIASRLQQSTRDNPHFFVSSSISVSKLMKLRQALNSSAEGKYKLSVNDFLIKAIASAAKKVPAANSSWQEGAIRQYNTVDVSVAVATPTGLITPIVKAAEGKGLEAISSSVKDLAKRARDGKLKPEEYQGGSISISNLGMNPAVDSFTAIINPPQSTILAIGSPKKVAIPAENEDGTTGVAWDDQIVITSSFDHKVVDGAVGAEFMKELKKVLENPLELLL